MAAAPIRGVEPGVQDVERLKLARDLAPTQRILELLWARVILPRYVLVQSEARTFLNLLAMMLIPMPVEQIRMPRWASPRDTALATWAA